MKIFDGQKGKRCDDVEYLSYTHKRCPKCGEVKAVPLFYRKKTKTSRGWAWDSNCIQCRRSACARYGVANRNQRNARLRAWRLKNPIAAKANDKRSRLKSKYDLSEQQVEEMRSTQHGKCAICQRSTTRLFVDHCHATGRVRSLLCQTCNTFLGWYERKADTILRFQNYIETHTPL